MSQQTSLVYDQRYLEHETGNHPENASRLQAIMDCLRENNALAKLPVLKPEKASPQQLAAVHAEEYIRWIKQRCRQGYGALGADTVVSPRSYEVARLAAGGAAKAVDEVLQGNTDHVFCLVRPPGHHAEWDRAMGFCLFNNVAVAAHQAISQHGLEKILIFDWDVHHGNGTQAAFYRDPRVLYCSVHQKHLFPGSGHIEQTGAGEGEGYTVNVPLEAGCTSADYQLVWQQVLAPVCDRFEPQLILVSAGQDAHADDALAGMQLSSPGYGAMASAVRDMAQKYCEGRMVLVLEGGYSPQGAPQAAYYILDALAGLGASQPAVDARLRPKEGTRSVVEEVRARLPWF